MVHLPLDVPYSERANRIVWPLCQSHVHTAQLMHDENLALRKARAWVMELIQKYVHQQKDLVRTFSENMESEQLDALPDKRFAIQVVQQLIAGQENFIQEVEANSQMRDLAEFQRDRREDAFFDSGARLAPTFASSRSSEISGTGFQIMHPADQAVNVENGLSKILDAPFAASPIQASPLQNTERTHPSSITEKIQHTLQDGVSLIRNSQISETEREIARIRALLESPPVPPAMQEIAPQSKAATDANSKGEQQRDCDRAFVSQSAGAHSMHEIALQSQALVSPMNEAEQELAKIRTSLNLPNPCPAILESPPQGKESMVSSAKVEQHPVTNHFSADTPLVPSAMQTLSFQGNALAVPMNEAEHEIARIRAFLDTPPTTHASQALPPIADSELARVHGDENTFAAQDFHSSTAQPSKELRLDAVPPSNSGCCAPSFGDLLTGRANPDIRHINSSVPPAAEISIISEGSAQLQSTSSTERQLTVQPTSAVNVMRDVPGMISRGGDLGDNRAIGDQSAPHVDTFQERRPGNVVRRSLTPARSTASLTSEIPMSNTAWPAGSVVPSSPRFRSMTSVVSPSRSPARTSMGLVYRQVGEIGRSMTPTPPMRFAPPVPALGQSMHPAMALHQLGTSHHSGAGSSQPLTPRQLNLMGQAMPGQLRTAHSAQALTPRQYSVWASSSFSQPMG